MNEHTPLIPTDHVTEIAAPLKHEALIRQAGVKVETPELIGKMMVKIDPANYPHQRVRAGHNRIKPYSESPESQR